MKSIEIRRPTETDVEKINSLIIDVFLKCVAPDYSKEGIEFFLSISKPEAIIQTLRKGTPIYIAQYKGTIIGVLWTRDVNHISRFFVDVSLQGNGIGKKLFNRLLKEIKTKHTEIEEVTVNSSPFAVKAYEKLGFIKTDEEKVGNGMRYIPMVYKIYGSIKNNR